MLTVTSLSGGYGKKIVIRDIDLTVQRGEICALVGPNGSGKTTLLRALFGMLAERSGRLEFGGVDISGSTPDRNVKLGLSFVPQGGRVFGDLSVLDNLRMGGFNYRDPSEVRRNMAEVFGLFPRLKERTAQLARGLSGGERQMLALGMALMMKPSMLLLDEPTLGLAPNLVADVLATIRKIRDDLGSTVLIVEQNIKLVLPISDRVVVLTAGQIRISSKVDDLTDHMQLHDAILGVSMGRNDVGSGT